MSMLYINGQYCDVSEATIPVTDRSYLFGEGLFESFRSFDGKIPLLKDHVNRLEWSTTFLELPFPKGVDFQKICDALLTKNKLKDARFKIVLSRVGWSSLDNMDAVDSVNRKSNLIVFCEPFDEKKTPPVYRLKVERGVVNDPLPLAAIKTTNYLHKVYARRIAQEAGYNDAVLLNAKGFVTETTTSNIFWVDKDAHLFTVASEQGLLDGVMKKKLKELFAASKLTCKEGFIGPDDLSSAREIFVTNSVIGIKPVVAVDLRQISGGEVGVVTAMIIDLWQKKMGTKF